MNELIRNNKKDSLSNRSLNNQSGSKIKNKNTKNKRKSK